jgi:hypothetical protein
LVTGGKFFDKTQEQRAPACELGLWIVDGELNVLPPGPDQRSSVLGAALDFGIFFFSIKSCDFGIKIFGGAL